MMAAGPTPGCLTCTDVLSHEADVGQLRNHNHDPANRPAVSPDFRTRVVCQVVTPHNTTDFTVDGAEAQFDIDHPKWWAEVTQIPPAPFYPEKLNMMLTTRARDLEENNPGLPRSQWPQNEEAQYTARIAAMGEALTSQAIAGEMRTRKAVPGFVISEFRFLENLATTRKTRSGRVRPNLEPLGVPPLKRPRTEYASKFGSVEHDAISFYGNRDGLIANCVQTKTIEHSNDTNIVNKIKEALGQTFRDVEAFLLLMPELTAANLQKFVINTMASLPSTTRPAWMCHNCSKHTLFREDLSPPAPGPLSWADGLAHALAAQSLPGPRPHLAASLGLDQLQPAGPDALRTLRTIMARYAGVSSLVPNKDEKEFMSKILKMLTRIEEQEVPRQLETALRLTPAQWAAVRSYTIMLCGMFGVGKTVVMIAIILRALADLNRFPNPAVFIVTWQEATGLQSRLKDRFASRPEVEVLSKEDLCTRFNITLDEEHRDQTVSAMCAALAALQRREGRNCLLCIDEMPPNIRSTGGQQEVKADTCDWTGLDTHGIACVICLQPTTDKYTTGGPVSVTAPASLDLVTLERVIRCTRPILTLLTWLMEQMAGSDPPAIPTGDIRPGHEITGALPQVLLHRQPCACSTFCDDPVAHHLLPLLPALLSLLPRLTATAGPAGLLVIMETQSDAARHRDWLRQEVAGLAGVRVSTMEEVRGTESGATLVIGDGWWKAGLTECASRTTGLLTLCTWPLKDDDSFDLPALMPRACREGRAEWAPEQDMLGGPPP